MSILNCADVEEFKEAVLNLIGDERALTRRWTIGGAWGGSCWGGTPESRPTKNEPDDVVLDKILEKMLPDIRLLELRRLSRQDLYDERVAIDWGYYGNYEEEKFKTLSLDRLYDELMLLVKARND